MDFAYAWRAVSSIGFAWTATVLCAGSQSITIEMDPAKTRIEWTLGDVLHTVHGTFQLNQGRIIYDPETQKVSGEIVVDTASGDSGNGARDRKMKKEVLETQRYPEARFVPARVDTPIATHGVSEARVSGTLDLHGTKHELTILMEIEFSGSDVKATGNFVIPYVTWGMKNQSTFVLRVDPTVRVDVSTASRMSGPTALKVLSF